MAWWLLQNSDAHLDNLVVSLFELYAKIFLPLGIVWKRTLTKGLENILSCGYSTETHDGNIRNIVVVIALISPLP